MISPIIRRLLENRLGHSIRYPSDCATLSIDISSVTGQHVGITTLKRIFGFVNDVAAPRVATLDILARYLDFPDFRTLLAEVGDDSDLLPLSSQSIILSAKQPHGLVLQISLPCPAHSFSIAYVGNLLWRVLSSTVPSLKPDDLLGLPMIIAGQPLVVVDIVRGCKSLGPIIIGSQHGIGTVRCTEGMIVPTSGL